MKKLIIIYIMVALLTGCGLRIELKDDSILNGPGFNFSTYEEFKEVTQTLSSDYFAYEQALIIEEANIDSLKLGTIFEDIKLIYEDRSDIDIKYFGVFSNENAVKTPELTLSDKGRGSFIVHWDKLTGISSGKMVVRMPKKYHKPLAIEGVSADVDGQVLKASNLDVALVSGDLEFVDMAVESLKITTVSGDVDIEALTASLFDFATTSGDVKVNGGVYETIIGNTVSGGVTLTIGEQIGDIQLKSTSGDIDLAIEANAAIKLKSVSGDIDLGNQFDSVNLKEVHKFETVIGSGTYDLTIGTTSGDIQLK